MTLPQNFFSFQNPSLVFEMRDYCLRQYSINNFLKTALERRDSVRVLLKILQIRCVKHDPLPPKALLLCVFCFRIDLNSREQETCQPVHVINVDIQDNHEEATLGAFLICELCQCVSREGSLPGGPRTQLLLRVWTLLRAAWGRCTSLKLSK